MSTPAGEVERWTNIVEWAMEQTIKVRYQYLEQMAAAYFQYTDIHPRDVVLVEEYEGARVKFYYASREEVLQEHGEGEGQGNEEPGGGPRREGVVEVTKKLTWRPKKGGHRAGDEHQERGFTPGKGPFPRGDHITG